MFVEILIIFLFLKPWKTNTLYKYIFTYYVCIKVILHR